MNALTEQFLAESREALDEIAQKLLALEEAPSDADLLTQLFRLVHTLKGNCGLFDLPEMARVLHAGEDLMSAVKASEHQVILAAIQATDNRVEAAKKLGISPRTLRYKLAQLRERGMELAVAG